MISIEPDFVAVGGNRHPAAADWDASTGLLAFGADHNIAVWKPLEERQRGVFALLAGHSAKVTVVRFWHCMSLKETLLLSGSVDKTIRLWRQDASTPAGFSSVVVLSEHQSSINVLTLEDHSGICASGSADKSVKLWKLDGRDGQAAVSLVQTIELRPAFLPLALALAPLTDDATAPVLLAVAGTASTVQIYVTHPAKPEQPLMFSFQFALVGHEGWIRSLALTPEFPGKRGDLLLASASQDKYIRLWRIHQGEDLPPAHAVAGQVVLGGFEKSLSNKAHRFQHPFPTYSVTFEALLLGHDDWVYTTAWCSHGGGLQLLSASADNSLAIWEADQASGVWVCTTRLGEISGQKGSTTATGSTGGFWIGLWSPNGTAVASLGRSGSWRLWQRAAEQNTWLPRVAVSGHTKAISGTAWAKDGSYLLTTRFVLTASRPVLPTLTDLSADQTTRLFAEWKKPAHVDSWHEFARPQIHGYDLNCIDTMPASRFISGADEKLLRVFEEPRTVAYLLGRLCGTKTFARSHMPDAANVPVLGLSNKATPVADDEELVVQDVGDEREAVDPGAKSRRSTLNIDHPPLEDHLARHTLWPEMEKLYGHGYEISAVASSHDGSVVATACRASSIEHALIRLFDTASWREIKPPLTAHALTVTRLQFSHDDQYLLSVGRDRQWSVFKRAGATQSGLYGPVFSQSKGHSRMVLDASWAPAPCPRVFATASRDKTAKIWAFPANSPGEEVQCKTTISAGCPVTSLAFFPHALGERLLLVLGLEDGTVQLVILARDSLAIQDSFTLDKRIGPSRSVTQVAWRPGSKSFDGVDASESDGTTTSHQLAVVSEDTSVRIYTVRLPILHKSSGEASSA
ncbi:MAG: hypothetical protein M1838_006050 [Thelocarpon superellum]|nr:MAG: hypothetical protein M1838_006050 [Thelocarpon superellum]